MQRALGALTILLLLAMVLIRAQMLRRHGTEAMHFGAIDRKDFLIAPFALFYFYTVFAAAFNLPLASCQEFFSSATASWAGVLFCLAGLVLLLLSLISFGKSFRVGIDQNHPDKLITTGVFAISRNPIYVAFWLVLLGEFLILANWIPLAYLCAATWLFHRQVRREEEFMVVQYGQEYADYCRRVRRYL